MLLNRHDRDGSGRVKAGWHRRTWFSLIAGMSFLGIEHRARLMTKLMS